MTRPDETLEGVLADHCYTLGLSTGSICECGYVPPRDPESLLSQQDWHRAHQAAAVRAWLLSDERVEAAIGGISDLRESRFQVGEYVTVDGVARAALSAALGGGDDGE